MNKQVRKYLIGLAKSNHTISYSNLNSQMQLGYNLENSYERELIGDLLEEISVFEFKKGRPLLSAIVIHKDTKYNQGRGFFTLCEELYADEWSKYKNKKSQEYIKECHDFWSNPKSIIFIEDDGK
jgi:hypothetical protein